MSEQEIDIGEQKVWAVKIEIAEDGKTKSVVFDTGYTYADAWVKSREVEHKYLEDGWHRGAWTLGKQGSNERILISVVHKPEGQVVADFEGLAAEAGEVLADLL